MSSLSFLNATPQLGMWQATGTAIAQSPNLTDLREPEVGGSNIEFDTHGHSILKPKPDSNGELTLIKTQTKTLTGPAGEDVVSGETEIECGRRHHKRHKHPSHCHRSLKKKHASLQKEPRGSTFQNGLKAF